MFMWRKAILTGLVVFSLLASPLASMADEGMWLPDTLGKLNLAQLKKRGFELKPEDVYNTAQPSLKDAIVQISIGGTGSFVSPEGLILTNHHVAFSAVTAASTTEKDYINNGFMAKSRAEEIQARNYSISITQDYKDVTAEVLTAVKPEMTPEERTRAITAKQQEIAKAAAAGRESEGIRTQVVEATGGYQYFLYTYLTLRDIRLVYADRLFRRRSGQLRVAAPLRRFRLPARLCQPRGQAGGLRSEECPLQAEEVPGDQRQWSARGRLHHDHGFPRPNPALSRILFGRVQPERANADDDRHAAPADRDADQDGRE